MRAANDDQRRPTTARSRRSRGARRRAGRAPGAHRAPAPRLPVGPRADGADDRPAHGRGGVRGRRRRARRRRREAARRARRPALPDVLPRAAPRRSAARATSSRSRAAIHAKLVARHPHVFGDAEARTAGRVRENWERIKGEQEGARGRLPRRARDAAGAAPRAQGAAARGGGRVRLPGRRRARSRDLDEELRELRDELPAADPAPETEPDPRVAAELGDVLFAVRQRRAAARTSTPSSSCGAPTQRFRDRVEEAERLARRATARSGASCPLERAGPRTSTEAKEAE